MTFEEWHAMRCLLSEVEFIGFLKGNIIKYSMRAGQNGDPKIDREQVRDCCKKLNQVMGK